MEKIEWKVDGMTCTNCALTINRYLQKEGQKEVKVNFIGGDVSFEMNGNKTKQELTKGIEDLGYKIVTEQPAGSGAAAEFETGRGSRTDAVGQHACAICAGRAANNSTSRCSGGRISSVSKKTFMRVSPID